MKLSSRQIKNWGPLSISVILDFALYWIALCCGRIANIYTAPFVVDGEVFISFQRDFTEENFYSAFGATRQPSFAIRLFGYWLQSGSLLRKRVSL